MPSTSELTFKAAINFFNGTKGAGESSPCSHNKNGKGTIPVILTNTANLDGLQSLQIYKTPKTCTPKYLVLQCSCGRHIVPSTCMSLNCPGCKKFVSKRRSNSIFRRLLYNSAQNRLEYKKYHRQTVIYTIFTVPIMERYKYFDRAAWQKVRKKVWRVLKEQFGAKYGVEVSHPVGDSDGSLFHPHLNFLWIQKSGFRPFLDVEKLRNAWSKVLNVDISDVYNQYSDKVRQIKHWCNYVSRTFPGTHEWTGPVRWYGKYPVINNKVYVKCAQCSSDFTAIGWIGKDMIDNYYKNGFMIGIDPPWMRDSQINFFKRGVENGE